MKDTYPITATSQNKIEAKKESINRNSNQQSCIQKICIDTNTPGFDQIKLYKKINTQ